MVRHNMSGMDAASKLLMANKAVAKDAINFILRKSGYAVVESSMQQRNVEAIAKLPGLRNLYKKISNDVVWELEVTDGGPPVRLLAAFENQSYPSRIMPLRGQLSTTVRMLAWRQETEDAHKARRELREKEERLDGVLEGDRPTPILPATVYFGQKEWPGKARLHGMMELPEKLRGYFADCPSNLLSFRDMDPKELSLMPVGTFRCVAICIRYADEPIVLRREWNTDPSFQLVDTMPSAACDVVSIAAGIDLRKANKEDNTMKKKMSTFEKVFRAEGRAEGRDEGRAEGIENTIRNFIERKRSRHVPEEQIHEELLLDFGLDTIQAKQYMEPSLVKA